MAISSNLRQISYSFNTNILLVNLVFAKKEKKSKRGGGSAETPQHPPPPPIPTWIRHWVRGNAPLGNFENVTPMERGFFAFLVTKFGAKFGH